jgi:hypothetical protein
MAAQKVKDSSRVSDIDRRISGVLRSIQRQQRTPVAEIARACDIPTLSLTRYLEGERAAPFHVLEAFGAATGESVESILRGAGVLPAIDIESLIDGDPQLTAEWKDILKSSYRLAVIESERKRREREQGKGMA